MKILRSQLKRIIKEELRNHYANLGLAQPTDDDRVIKKAYRNMSKKHHPDKGGTLEKMKAINTSKLLTGKQKNLPAALKQKIIKAKMKKMKKVKKKNGK